MLKLTAALLIVCGLVVLTGCSEPSVTATSPTTPSTPTPPPPSPVVNPLVTIQVTYNCHPCFNDADNYAINVDCGNLGCAAKVHPANWLLEHNTMTFTGRLAPGSHNFEVMVTWVEGPVVIALLPAGELGNTGIRPDSLRVMSSDTPSVDVLAISRCGLVNTFRTRPTTQFDSVFAFDVVSGSISAVC